MSRLSDLFRDYCAKGVPHKTLGELGSITRGKRFVKADIVDSGIPCIHYGEIYTKYGTSADKTFSFLKPELASRLRVASPGDVIIASAGETIEDIGKAVAWLGDQDVVIHDACYAFRSAMEPKFVAYYLQTDAFHNQVRRHISSSKISAISTEKLGNVVIPVPHQEIQKEIVNILDSFAKLDVELELELRAELEARRKQYRHYRDQLLTFLEAE